MECFRYMYIDRIWMRYSVCAHSIIDSFNFEFWTIKNTTLQSGVQGLAINYCN